MGTGSRCDDVAASGSLPRASSEAGQDAEAGDSRGRSSLPTLEQAADLSVVPDLTVHHHLIVSSVPEQPDGSSPLDRSTVACPMPPCSRA